MNLELCTLLEACTALVRVSCAPKKQLVALPHLLRVQANHYTPNCFVWWSKSQGLRGGGGGGGGISHLADPPPPPPPHTHTLNKTYIFGHSYIPSRNGQRKQIKDLWPCSACAVDSALLAGNSGIAGGGGGG